MNLIQELQTLISKAQNELPMVEEGVQAVAQVAAAIVPQSQVETNPAPHASVPLTPEPPKDTLGAIASTVGEVASVVSLVPGLQATSLVKLLTLSVGLVNAVEEIKNDVQKNSPNAWAEIESVFSSAVSAFHAVPKS